MIVSFSDFRKVEARPRIICLRVVRATARTSCELKQFAYVSTSVQQDWVPDYTGAEIWWEYWDISAKMNFYAKQPDPWWSRLVFRLVAWQIHPENSACSPYLNMAWSANTGLLYPGRGRHKYSCIDESVVKVIEDGFFVAPSREPDWTCVRRFLHPGNRLPVIRRMWDSILFWRNPANSSSFFKGRASIFISVRVISMRHDFPPPVAMQQIIPVTRRCKKALHEEFDK